MVIPGYNVRLQFDRDELARCGGEGGGVGRVQWSKDPGAGQFHCGWIQISQWKGQERGWGLNLTSIRSVPRDIDYKVSRQVMVFEQDWGGGEWNQEFWLWVWVWVEQNFAKERQGSQGGSCLSQSHPRQAVRWEHWAAGQIGVRSGIFARPGEQYSDLVTSSGDQNIT